MADRAREQAPERLEVVEGDITDRRLKLSDEDYERLAAEVTQVYHLAAIYDLAVPIEAAQAVNVDGTGNILDFCLACESLERLHYVSTAYVAGMRTGVVYEHELSLGQRLQEPLRVDQVPGRGLGAPADGPHPHHDLPPGDRGRRLQDRRDGEVRRPLLHAARRSRSRHGSSSRSPRFGRAEATVQRRAGGLRDRGDARAARGRRRHAAPRRPRPDQASEIFDTLAEAYAGKKTAYRLPPKAVAASLHVPAVRKFFAGAPRRVDPVPQPPGALRHAPRRAGARAPRASAARTSRTTSSRW